MTQRKRITRNILLSFDLTKFLIEHPSITERFEPDNFVVFTENDNRMNEKSNDLLGEMKKKGKKAVKATRKSGTKNDWRFELVTP